MSEYEELRELMLRDHGKVLLGIGRLEGAVESLRVEISHAKQDRAEIREALIVADAKINAHILHFSQYRSWLIGFSAAATMTFAAIWSILTLLGAETLKILFGTGK